MTILRIEKKSDIGVGKIIIFKCDNDFCEKEFKKKYSKRYLK
jgi:hypothetical protein